MNHTLTGPVAHEIVVNRSRFLALADPATDPETAMAVLARRTIADASHNCWAYRLGDTYRFNDDGEPGGTAGRPILAAIDGQGFDQVVVLVARWFGGVKLGAGGLVRAYGGCAAECLRTAPRQSLIAMTTLTCVVDFALEQPLRAALGSFDTEVADRRYDGDGLHLVLRLPVRQLDALRSRLTDLARGRILFEERETRNE